MHSRFEHNSLVWVDFESPSREEIQAASQEFGFTHPVAEELLVPATRPRAEFHGDYAYIVMHFPALHHSHKTQEQEIDFVIGKKFILTARYDTIDSMHSFSKVFQVNSVLDKSTVGDHAGFLFFYMLKKLYKAVEYEIEYIRHELHMTEEHIFSGHEIQMVSAISRSARNLLNLRQTIEPHREILHELEEHGAAFFGEEFMPYIRALSNEYYRVHNHIMRHTEFLHELRESNNSLLTTKQNETMKRFTILAFTTFPLTLIAAIFSMDTVHEPIVGAPFDWWIIIGLMVLLTCGMFTYFKAKKWL